MDAKDISHLFDLEEQIQKIMRDYDVQYGSIMAEIEPKLRTARDAMYAEREPLIEEANRLRKEIEEAALAGEKLEGVEIIQPEPVWDKEVLKSAKTSVEFEAAKVIPEPVVVIKRVS